MIWNCNSDDCGTLQCPGFEVDNIVDVDYDRGSRIRFTNSLGDTLSFFAGAVGISDSYNCEACELNECDCAQFAAQRLSAVEEPIAVDIQVNTVGEIPGNREISYVIYKEGSLLSTIGFYTHYTFLDPAQLYSTSEVFDDNYMQDGILFSDVFVGTLDTMDLPRMEVEAWKIWWSEEFGIIRFLDRSNGSDWRLIIE